MAWPADRPAARDAAAVSDAPVHGYGRKTLADKLGLAKRPDWRVLSVDAPDGYAALLADVWPLANHVAVRGRRAVAGQFDLVHLFVPDEATLAERLPAVLPRLADGGALWVSWPKKSSPLFRDLTEDGLRRLILPTGWVDVKVAAVNETWSGLKFLRRRT